MTPRRDARALFCLSGFLLVLFAALNADFDWLLAAPPTARTQDKDLAPQLYLQWVREYPPLRPAWPDQPRLQFDAAYRPVALGNTLFVGSSRTDSLTALDADTGEEKWRFHADGPVRFPAAVWRDRVYFAS